MLIRTVCQTLLVPPLALAAASYSPSTEDFADPKRGFLIGTSYDPNSIVNQAAELTRNLLVIEFVSPQDSMFRRLVWGREELHRDLIPEVFENSCRRRFEIVRSQHIEGTTRWLYLMRRKER